MIRVNTEFLNYVTRLKNSGDYPMLVEEEVPAGEKIIVQKTKVFALYVIKSGMVKCYHTIDTGTYFIQEFFGEGEPFGEIEIFTEAYSFCTVEALTPMSYFKISKTDLEELIKKDKTFNNLILKMMASKIRYTAVRHSYNQSHSLEQNLKRLVNDFPDLLQKISKTDIANYLGITVRSLNRVLKN
ncbi:Crp/Fnr family transcriptional regulator [Flagellimonas sp. 2504JD4-2]